MSTSSSSFDCWFSYRTLSVIQGEADLTSAERNYTQTSGCAPLFCPGEWGGPLSVVVRTLTSRAPTKRPQGKGMLRFILFSTRLDQK